MQALQVLHSSFASDALARAERASEALESSYAAFCDDVAAQQQQMDLFVEQQRASAQAALAATQAAVASATR